jgi:uncharacterized protein (DUF1330 family)
MPKAYAINAYRSVSDPQELAAYAELALPAITPFGARVLARGNAAMAFEHGLKRAHRHRRISKFGEGNRCL